MPDQAFSGRGNRFDVRILKAPMTPMPCSRNASASCQRFAWVAPSRLSCASSSSSEHVGVFSDGGVVIELFEGGVADARRVAEECEEGRQRSLQIRPAFRLDPADRNALACGL